jgi:DNA mismatch endonuclease (patch repair protein)
MVEPTPSSERVSRQMRSQKSKNTECEINIRRILHSEGLRYRVHARPIPNLGRTADIVFGPKKVAVFVDGCFWHSCPEHRSAPKANAEWWSTKLSRTSERDADTDRQLKEAGWTTIRVWEHEDPAEAAQKVRLALSKVAARRKSSDGLKARRLGHSQFLAMGAGLKHLTRC